MRHENDLEREPEVTDADGAPSLSGPTETIDLSTPISEAIKRLLEGATCNDARRAIETDDVLRQIKIIAPESFKQAIEPLSQIREQLKDAVDEACLTKDLTLEGFINTIVVTTPQREKILLTPEYIISLIEKNDMASRHFYFQEVDLGEVRNILAKQIRSVNEMLRSSDPNLKIHY